MTVAPPPMRVTGAGLLAAGLSNLSALTAEKAKPLMPHASQLSC